MTTADAIRQAGDRCVALLRVREGRAANDNDCRPAAGRAK